MRPAASVLRHVLAAGLISGLVLSYAGASDQPDRALFPKGGGSSLGIEGTEVGVNDGSFRFQFEVPVPKGRNGFQPSLTLTYHSGSGENELGLGWNLSKSSIQRVARKVPRYDEQDAFSSSEFGELAPLGNDYYVPIRNPTGITIRFDREHRRWIVWLLNGERWVYATPETNGETGGAPESAHESKIYRWYLTSRTDSAGNRIEWSYRHDLSPHRYNSDSAQNGAQNIDAAPVLLLDEVRYGFVSGTPVSRITLQYDTIRTAGRVQTRAGFAQWSGESLTSISTFNRDENIGKVLLSYDKQKTDSPFLFLAQIQRHGSNDLTDTPFPATKFEYASNAADFLSDVSDLEIPSTSLIGNNPQMGLSVFADLNGDGLPDLYEQNQGSGNAAFNRGDRKFDKDFRSFSKIRLRPLPQNILLDANGDGILDLIDPYAKRPIFLNQRDQWSDVGTSGPPTGIPLAQLIRLDANGDSVLDFWDHSNGEDRCLFSNENGTWNAPETVASVEGPLRQIDAASEIFRYGDFNGDGLVDIARIGRETSYAWLSLGWCRWSQPYTLNIPDELTRFMGGNLSFLRVDDVNSDGFADWIYSGPRQIQIFLNRGDLRFATGPTITTKKETIHYSQVLDVDGDGQSDWIVCGRHASCELHSSPRSSARSSPHASPTKTKPGLLTVVSSALGPSEHIRYGTTAAFSKNSGLPFAIPVVTEKRVTDGPYPDGSVHDERISYSYNNPWWDPFFREFRGFETVLQKWLVEKASTFQRRVVSRFSTGKRARRLDLPFFETQMLRSTETLSSGDLIRFEKHENDWQPFAGLTDLAFLRKRTIRRGWRDPSLAAAGTETEIAASIQTTFGGYGQPISERRYSSGGRNLYTEWGYAGPRQRPEHEADLWLQQRISETHLGNGPGSGLSGGLSNDLGGNMTGGALPETRWVFDDPTSSEPTQVKQRIQGDLWKVDHCVRNATYTGNCDRIIDAKGEILRSFVYDPEGIHVLQEVNGESEATVRTWDARGRLVTETDPNHTTTRWTYDDRDRVTSKERKKEDRVLSLVTYQYTDSKTGVLGSRRTTETILGSENLAIGSRETMEWTDGFGRVHRQEKTGPESTRVVTRLDRWDRAGNLRSSLKDPQFLTDEDRGFRTIDREVNGLGQITSLRWPKEKRTHTFAYDLEPRGSANVLTVRATDSRGHDQTTVVDADGNTIEQRFPRSAGLERLYGFTYDDLSRLIGVTTSGDGIASKQITYLRNGLGEVASTRSEQTGLVTRFFDHRGRLSERYVGTTRVEKQTYDRANRLLERDFGDEKRTFSYGTSDADNNVGRVTEAQVGLDTAALLDRFQYGPFGTVVRWEREHAGQPAMLQTYTLDSLGQRLTATLQGDQLTYARDAAGFLTGIQSAEFSVTGISHAADLSISGFTTDDSVDHWVRTTTRTPETGLVEHYGYQNKKDERLSQTYGYDSEENLISDRLGDLLPVTFDYSASSLQRLEKFTVDGTTTDLTPDTRAVVRDAFGRTTEVPEAGVVRWTNHLFPRGIDTTAFAFDTTNTIAAVTSPQDTALFHGSEVTLHARASSEPQFVKHLFVDGVWAGSWSGNQHQWIAVNARQTPVAVLAAKSDSGKKAWKEIRWGPYGELLEKPDSLKFPLWFGLGGAQRDPETQTVFLGARSYAPQTKEFLNADPLALRAPESFVTSPMQLELFRYANDNPQRFVDPSGENPLVVVGVALAGYSLYQELKPPPQSIIDAGGIVPSYLPEAIFGAVTTGVQAAKAGWGLVSSRTLLGASERTLGVETGRFVRDLPDLPEGSFKGSFEGHIFKGPMLPGDVVYQAQRAGQKNPGNFFTPVKPVSSQDAIESLHLGPWKNDASQIKAYRFTEPVSGYAGKINGGSGHQFMVPEGVPVHEVLQEIK